jgi:hypothetical protein
MQSFPPLGGPFTDDGVAFFWLSDGRKQTLAEARARKGTYQLLVFAHGPSCDPKGS